MLFSICEALRQFKKTIVFYEISNMLNCKCERDFEAYGPDLFQWNLDCNICKQKQHFESMEAFRRIKFKRKHRLLTKNSYISARK